MPSAWQAMMRRARQEGEAKAKAKGLIYHGRGVLTGYNNSEVESYNRFKSTWDAAVATRKKARVAYESSKPNPNAVRGSWRLEEKRKKLKRKYGDTLNQLHSIKCKRHKELCVEAKRGGRHPPSVSWMGASCTAAARKPASSPSLKLGTLWTDQS